MTRRSLETGKCRNEARLLFAIGLLALTSAAGCYTFSSPIGVPLPTTNRFEFEWRHYGRLAPNKSIAVAGDMSGVYVSGYAYRQESEMAAVDAALAACESRRLDKRLESPCRTYAIGDSTIDTASSSAEVVIR